MAPPDSEPDHADTQDGDGQGKTTQKTQAKKPSPLKNPLVRLALVAGAIILLILFGLWFFHYWTRGRFLQSTNDAYLQADQVSISARVSAFVDEIYVVDNQTVRAGQPLARLDARTAQAQVAKAQGQQDQAQASIDQARAQISQQQAVIAQNQAQLAGAHAQAVFAQAEASRYRTLAAAGAETGEKFDQMVQNLDQANATVAQDKAAVDAARRQIASYQAQIEQAQAQVKQAAAQKAANQVDLDATLVRSSIAGRIGDKQARIGQYVQAGTRLMSVVPVEDIYVIANFKETQLGLMRAGQPVSITLDALKGETLHGEVESFSPGTGSQFALIPPNNATGNFTKIVQRVPVRIRVEAGETARKVLVSGLSATVSVDTVGAKADSQARKQEAHAEQDQARRETRRQIDDDKRSHTIGPGTH